MSEGGLADIYIYGYALHGRRPVMARQSAPTTTQIGSETTTTMNPPVHHFFFKSRSGRRQRRRRRSSLLSVSAKTKTIGPCGGQSSLFMAAEEDDAPTASSRLLPTTMTLPVRLLLGLFAAAATLTFLCSCRRSSFAAEAFAVPVLLTTPAPRARAGPRYHTYRLPRRGTATPSSLSSVLSKTALLSQAALVPEENPNFDPEATSTAGVPYGPVLRGLHRIFPPEALDRRNALSRSDGYWPYIQRGDEPPPHTTYGEFDFYFFAQLLDGVLDYFYNADDDCNSYSGRGEAAATTTKKKDWSDKVFVDIGSGTGRLVLAAAALHPNWRLCRGVELLEKIHRAAQDNLEQMRRRRGDGDDDSSSTYAMPVPSPDKSDEAESERLLPMAPVEFECGSFGDPYVYFGDADLVFVFGSCLGEDLISELAQSIGRQCKPGTIVITTEYMLPLEGFVEPYSDDDNVPSGPYKLEFLKSIDGWCYVTGGVSTAYIHRVTESLWDPDRQEPLRPPEMSVEDQAYEVAKAMEAGELTDPQQFLRNVYNNMAFNDIPESFRPNIDNSGL